jgi:hypothetical protein
MENAVTNVPNLLEATEADRGGAVPEAVVVEVVLMNQIPGYC